MFRSVLARSTGLASIAVLAGARIGTAQTASPVPSPQQTVRIASAVEEVTVTATRRSENVSKVPYNITAISGAALAARGVTDLASLRNQTPGLTSADYGTRGASVNNNFIIRGINSDAVGTNLATFPKLGAASVSTYIDETPLFVNLKLDDIQRVEILRGPQGTLFGADSVGGTIRLLHNKPDTEKYSYTLEGTLSGTDHADKLNSAANLTLNVPVTRRVAVRLNAGYDRLGGFIDADNATVLSPNGHFLPFNAQPVLADPGDIVNSPQKTEQLHGINSSNVWYVRGDMLARVTDDLVAELSYQHQNDSANGFSYEYPGTDYVLHRKLPLDPSLTRTDLAALTLTQDFGFATVTSSTSYYNVDTTDLYDNSGLDFEFPGYYGAYPRITTPNYDFNQDRAFTEEVRLVSPKGEHVDYVAGIYFQNRRNRADSVETVPGFAEWANQPGTGPEGYTSWADYVVNYFGGTRPGTLPIADESFDFKRDVQFTNLAGFGEATLHLTPKWNLAGGVRVFHENFRQSTIQHFYVGGLFFGADTLGTSSGSGTNSSTSKIFKANTSYAITPATLAYFTFSQGYRSAGANAFPIGTCFFCNSAALVPYRPDTANNYEVGLKGHAGPVRYSSALYWIEWNNIQQEVGSNAGTPVVVNGKTARSRGVELEGTWPVVETVSLSGGYTYTNAVLTQGFSIVDNGRAFASAATGALLPGVSKHQFNLGADYTPMLLDDRPVDFHLDMSYRSGFTNEVQSNLSDFRHLSGFAMLNASVQAEVAPRVTLQLFVHNLTNAKGVTATGYRATQFSALANAANVFDAVEFVSRPLTAGIKLTIHG